LSLYKQIQVCGQNNGTENNKAFGSGRNNQGGATQPHGGTLFTREPNVHSRTWNIEKGKESNTENASGKKTGKEKT